MRNPALMDLLERLAIDPGRRTLGELLQDREWARLEIEALRRRLAERDPGASGRGHRGRPSPPPLRDASSGPSVAAPSVQAGLRPVADPGVDPAQRMLRLKHVVELIKVSRSTIYKWIASGEFPAPVRLGIRGTAWRLSDVLAWQAKLEAKPTRSGQR